MQALLPSPAIAIVGRHNSGKTTLVEALIAHLSARGHDVGSIKHHSHAGFEIDIPGKDSYRHRHAGATETVVAAPGQMALIKDLPGELSCAQLVESMPGHDIIVVEGYRKSGLPTIEVMRAANPADAAVAQAFLQAARTGEPLSTDFVQSARAQSHGDSASAGVASPFQADIQQTMPTATTVAVATDIPEAHEAAALFGIPAFNINDTHALADFIEAHYVRTKLSVVIQAGGESRRMGQSKALVPFGGRPLIQHMVERLLPVADELIVTTNEAHRLQFLYQEFPDARLRLVPDLLDRRGSLPGMLTALSAATHPYVAVIACDMVFASPRLVAAESIEALETGADIVVPVNAHGFEPFHALYARENCLAAVQQRLGEGASSVH